MKFFSKKQKSFTANGVNRAPSYCGKIEVFSRHCLFSSISAHKKRLVGFDRAKCYRNLLATSDPSQVNMTFFLDTAGKKKGDDHYLQDSVIEISAGSEALSFLHLLDHVSQLSLHPDTIVYFVEDDYLHRPGWLQVLREGFEIEEADYITLYDHKDKYFLPMYKKLTSRLFITHSTHWRSTPSTTQTFAMRFKTLLRDLPIHRRFSEGRSISADHEKFIFLQKKGAQLLSSVPGWATHVEEPFASPCIDWSTFLQ